MMTRSEVLQGQLWSEGLESCTMVELCTLILCVVCMLLGRSWNVLDRGFELFREMKLRQSEGRVEESVGMLPADFLTAPAPRSTEASDTLAASRPASSSRRMMIAANYFSTAKLHPGGRHQRCSRAIWRLLMIHPL